VEEHQHQLAMDIYMGVRGAFWQVLVIGHERPRRPSSFLDKNCSIRGYEEPFVVLSAECECLACRPSRRLVLTIELID
jgi:hypothetical protein